MTNKQEMAGAKKSTSKAGPSGSSTAVPQQGEAAAKELSAVFKASSASVTPVSKKVADQEKATTPRPSGGREGVQSQASTSGLASEAAGRNQDTPEPAGESASSSSVFASGATMNITDDDLVNPEITDDEDRGGTSVIDVDGVDIEESLVNSGDVLNEAVMNQYDKALIKALSLKIKKDTTYDTVMAYIREAKCGDRDACRHLGFQSQPTDGQEEECYCDNEYHY